MLVQHDREKIDCPCFFCQVVFPNVLLRDSDVELFEDNPLEPRPRCEKKFFSDSLIVVHSPRYVRRDMEAADQDTRLRPERRGCGPCKVALFFRYFFRIFWYYFSVSCAQPGSKQARKQASKQASKSPRAQHEANYRSLTCRFESSGFKD